MVRTEFRAWLRTKFWLFDESLMSGWETMKTFFTRFRNLRIVITMPATVRARDVHDSETGPRSRPSHRASRETYVLDNVEALGNARKGRRSAGFVAVPLTDFPSRAPQYSPASTSESPRDDRFEDYDDDDIGYAERKQASVGTRAISQGRSIKRTFRYE